ncbi:hypothetical protein ACFQV2_12795 [Actinokineospora soli]|uniref:Regulatory protein, arsR family n=1 Tax=Actinokineospora soli TaxID=1048753 RepID=A0ABW2TM03_9PSEU
MPPSSLSHHLKILVSAGILSRERRGTWSWYGCRRSPADRERAAEGGRPLEGPRPGGALTRVSTLLPACCARLTPSCIGRCRWLHSSILVDTPRLSIGRCR